MIRKLIATSAVLLFSLSGLGAQEGHGGNHFALQFVKIGRVIQKLNVVDPDQLNNAIDNTFVRAGDGVFGFKTEKDFGGTPVSAVLTAKNGKFRRDQIAILSEGRVINLNQKIWKDLSCREKFVNTLHVYIAAMNLNGWGKTFDDDFRVSSKIADFLGDESICRSMIASQGESGKRLATLDRREQVRKLGETLVQLLKNPKMAVERNALCGKDLEEVIRKLRFTFTNGFNYSTQSELSDKDMITLVGFPLLPLCREKVKIFDDADSWTQFIENDGETFRGNPYNFVQDIPPTEQVMLINAKVWDEMWLTEKLEMLFHEYLAPIDHADLYYHVSSKLYVDAVASGISIEGR